MQTFDASAAIACGCAGGRAAGCGGLAASGMGWVSWDGMGWVGVWWRREGLGWFGWGWVCRVGLSWVGLCWVGWVVGWAGWWVGKSCAGGGGGDGGRRGDMIALPTRLRARTGSAVHERCAPSMQGPGRAAPPPLRPRCAPAARRRSRCAATDAYAPPRGTRLRPGPARRRCPLQGPGWRAAARLAARGYAPLQPTPAHRRSSLRRPRSAALRASCGDRGTGRPSGAAPPVGRINGPGAKET